MARRRYLVMAGLDPAIYPQSMVHIRFDLSVTVSGWMAGSSPAKTSTDTLPMTSTHVRP